MTQTKHTPAPWEVAKSMDFKTSIYGRNKKRPIATLTDESGDDYWPKAKTEANAQLIAAAPDYDDAAKLAITVLECDKQVIHAKKYGLESECEKCRALDALYAACEKAGTIAKAEGRA